MYTVLNQFWSKFCILEALASCAESAERAERDYNYPFCEALAVTVRRGTCNSAE